MKSTSENISIRIARPSDALGIRRAQRMSWVYAYDHVVPRELIRERYKIKPESIAFIKSTMNKPENRIWVITKNEKVVGFCHAKKGKPSEIEALYLMKSLWGKGLGKRLIEKALKWLGKGEVAIWTEVGNERAIRFYEKYGFKKTKKKSIFHAKMLDKKFNIIMMKKTN